MFIYDGHPTLINLGAITTLKEKTITPPGVDGGGENDTTTMHNVTWRTRQPKKLKTMTSLSGTFLYDPKAITDIVALTNVNSLKTITFPDLSTLAVWSWINQFIPGENTEGEGPTAEVEVIVSNQNNSGTEVAPVYTAPPPLIFGGDEPGFDEGGLEMTEEQKAEMRQYWEDEQKQREEAEEDQKRLYDLERARIKAIENHALAVTRERRKREIEWRERQLEILKKYAENPAEFVQSASGLVVPKHAAKKTTGKDKE